MQWLVLLLLTACFPGPAASTILVAQPSEVDVIDGDSLVVKRGRHEVEIRLFGIDAPEHQQPWARQSREALRKLIDGQVLRIEEVNRDRYERTVARVYLIRDGSSVNAAMVASGHAWVFRRYSKDREWLRLEKQARQSRLGLWQLPERQRVPPWQWRKDNGGR